MYFRRFHIPGTVPPAAFPDRPFIPGLRQDCRYRIPRQTGSSPRVQHGLLHITVHGLVRSVCRRGKALFQIGDNVVDVLGSDGQADRVSMDILLLQLLGAEPGMRRARRVDDQGLDISDIRQQRENLQRVDECVRFLHAALDVKGEDGGTAVGKVFLKQSMVGVLRQ